MTKYDDGMKLLDAEIDDAIQIIKNGGIIDNKTVTVYRKNSDNGVFDYTTSEYSIFNYLFRKYDITVPLKVQGFVNDKLYSVEYTEKDGVSYRYYRRGKSKGSTTLHEYLHKLRDAVIAA